MKNILKDKKIIHDQFVLNQSAYGLFLRAVIIIWLQVVSQSNLGFSYVHVSILGTTVCTCPTQIWAFLSSKKNGT